MVKRPKNKDLIKNLRELAENEYLKKLEKAVTGKSGDILYLKSENKHNAQFPDEVDIWDKLEPKTTPVKETPRIPIEWALGDGNNQTVHVEQESKPNVLSIDEIVKEQQIPVIEEPSPPPAPPIKEKTPPPPPPPPPPQPPPPPPLPQPQPKIESQPPPVLVKALYDSGTIIRLEDESISVYKGPIPGKEYHLIYYLRPDGTISPEGICLYAYRSEPLGRINESLLEEMLRSMRWERDRIIDHLSSREKNLLIPLLSPKRIKMEVSELPRKRDSLERGRRLRIGIGDKVWDAVYWGSDELGQIVAHNTNKTWTLMHLNLGRFGDSIEHGELISPEELKDINASLSETLSIGD